MSNLGVSALTTSAMSAIKALTTRKAYIQDYFTQHTIIQVDASIRETHGIDSKPSEFPIESGQVICDNFVIQPFTLDMDGMISDDPVNPITAGVTSALSTVLPPAGIIAGSAAVAVFNAIQGNKNPSVANFNQFVQMVVTKKIVNIYTTLNFYTSMWLASLRVDRDASLGSALSFKAHFVQVILVKPQIVDLGKYANPKVSTSQANLGQSAVDNSNVNSVSATNGMISATGLVNSAFNTAGLK